MYYSLSVAVSLGQREKSPPIKPPPAAFCFTCRLCVLLQTAAADLAGACSHSHTSHNSSSSNSNRLQLSIKAPEDGCAVVSAAVAAAIAAQQHVLFSRADRLDLPLLLAFTNAVAVSRGQAAATGSQNQKQKQQEAEGDFFQRVQRFLPLKLLRRKTITEIYRHSIPRQACGEPAYLLQHWRYRAVLVAESAAMDKQQHQRDAATRGTAAIISAADFLLHELQFLSTAEMCQTPVAYARHLIA